MGNFHLATGQGQAPKPTPEAKPRFHPAVGYSKPGEDE
jgi:hypothetical protein